MSRWLYQMSERGWPSAEYRATVREGRALAWPVRSKAFAKNPPKGGDVIICFYAKTDCDRPGICGWGIIEKTLRRGRWFRWIPLWPTDAVKASPWWDERVEEIVESVRGNQPRRTMYSLPPALETDLRRGSVAWATRVARKR